MDQLANLQRQLQDLSYDFQRSVRSLSSLSAANESSIDAVEKDLDTLRVALHNLDVRVSVLENMVKTAPKFDDALGGVYARINTLVGDINTLTTQVAVLKQRIEDHLPIRRDQTPLGVPTQAQPPAPHERQQPDIAAMSRDIATKWSPHLASLIALLLAAIQQCNAHVPRVEQTGDGHTRVVIPVAANEQDRNRGQDSDPAAQQHQAESETTRARSGSLSPESSPYVSNPNTIPPTALVGGP